MLQYCFENTELNSEQKRILETSLEAYEVRGITLPEEQQTRLKEISQKLSELSQNFSNNILDSRNDFSYHIEDASNLDEMPQDDKDVAQERASKKKLS